MSLPRLIRHLVTGVLAGVTVAGLSSNASGAQSRPGRPGLEIRSALVIAKSTNKNQVHYAVEVDEACAPAGQRPVSPYWLMLERGPDVTEPLRESEQRVLGVERQEVTTDGIHIALRGLPRRTLTIHTWRAPGGTCASSVDTTVAGVMARLASVYVKQKLFGVDYVLLTGVSAEGAVVEERVVP